MATKSGVEVEELKAYVDELLEENQEISLSNSSEEDTENSHMVKARHVSVRYSDDSSVEDPVRHHSHYVSTKPCIDYKWAKDFYHGHLIAVHMSGRVFAYVLQTHHTGKVRVTSDEAASQDGRCLLNQFASQVVDVDFAHVPDAIYIACMEQNGWCWVFSIPEDKPMRYELLVKMRISEKEIDIGQPCRAIWCVHVPEPGQKAVFLGDDDPSSRLILTSGGQAAVVSVPLVKDAAAATDKAVTFSTADSGTAGVARIDTGALIWDGKMSPDGVVLCLAREDGNINFYQCVSGKGESLGGEKETASMVYTWTPHDGRPVHSVHFFDDFTATSKQEQFWMFAVSGSEFGRQFRIWNCQHWYCLQTIDILPSLARPLEEPQLQVTVDPKGDYLILGDSLRNLVMFLRVDKDVVKRLATVTSVNEFLVGSPILNLVAVSLRAIRPDPESLLPLDPEENGFESRLLTVHHKVLQHMTVTFVGEQLPNVIPSTSDSSSIMDISRGEIHNNSPPTVIKHVAAPPPAVVVVPTPSSSSLSSQGVNGEMAFKVKEKKSRKVKKIEKNRETFGGSLDDVPTPSVPTPVVDTNGSGRSTEGSRNELFKLEEPELERPQSVSPAFVLQPPSVFDQVTEVRRDSSQQSLHHGGGSQRDSPHQLATSSSRSKENILTGARNDSSTALGSGSLSTHSLTSTLQAGSPSTFDNFVADFHHVIGKVGSEFSELQNPVAAVNSADSLQNFIRTRDVSVSSFTAPPVEDESHGESFLSMRPRKGEASPSTRLFEQSDLSRSSALTTAAAISSERLDRVENTLAAIATALDQQSQLVTRLTASVDSLKVSQQNGTSASHDDSSSSKRSLDLLSKSLAGPLKEMSGLENRLSTSMDTLGRTIEGNVAKELKNQMGLSAQKVLKPVGDKLAGDVVARLTGLDGVVRQKLEEVVRNPQFGQVIAQSVAPVFAEGARQALQDVVSNQLVASYQQIMNQSLLTLNQTFGNGTKEYLTHVTRLIENHFGAIDQVFEERFQEVTRSVERTSSAAAAAMTKDLLTGIQDIIQQNIRVLYDQIMANLGGQISQKVTACVKEELREQQSVMHESMVNALRSGVATPGPGQQMMASQQRTLMQDVKAALDKRQYNAAFRLALTATDLDAVLYVCEKCPLKEVFGRPDVLEMAVLFSMVQQLGVDIGSRTRLKVEYLEESLFAIGGRFEDLDHNSFKYLRRVLQDLVKLLSKFMQAHPEHDMYRNIRMIAQNAELQLRQIDAMHGGAGLKQEVTHD